MTFRQLILAIACGFALGIAASGGVNVSNGVNFWCPITECIFPHAGL